MKIFYTHQAIYDLKRLHQFIAKDSPKAAAAASAKIRQAIERLIDFPKLGRAVKNTEKSISLRDVVTGKYVIRYILLKHEIHILRVWHGKEDKPAE